MEKRRPRAETVLMTLRAGDLDRVAAHFAAMSEADIDRTLAAYGADPCAVRSGAATVLERAMQKRAASMRTMPTRATHLHAIQARGPDLRAARLYGRAQGPASRPSEAPYGWRAAPRWAVAAAAFAIVASAWGEGPPATSQNHTRATRADDDAVQAQCRPASAGDAPHAQMGDGTHAPPSDAPHAQADDGTHALACDTVALTCGAPAPEPCSRTSPPLQ